MSQISAIDCTVIKFGYFALTDLITVLETKSQSIQSTDLHSSGGAQVTSFKQLVMLTSSTPMLHIFLWVVELNI
jgi:hypothetical protein